MFIPYGAVMKASKLKHARHVQRLDTLSDVSNVFNRYGKYIEPIVKGSDFTPNLTRQVFASQHGYSFIRPVGGTFNETGTVAKYYKRRAFNISNAPTPKIQETFIQDLSRLSGQSIESVTETYNKILKTKTGVKQTFKGTQQQYNQTKAYFQALNDLNIAKRNSAYVIINTPNGPVKYFADSKVTGRINPISLDKKLDRQKIVNVERWKRILNQTLDPEDLGKWHSKMAKELGDEAHHLNELHLVGVMTEGRSADSIASVIKRLNNEMIFTGNSTFNKINLPKPVHNRIHVKMREVFADYKNIDFTKMSDDQLVNFFKTDYKLKMQQIQETIFSEMQLYRQTK